MGAADPHIHVDAKFHADATARTILASTFGLAADLPPTVTTGCGLRVPHAMTSTHPANVTCLACRDFAHRHHLRLADQLEHLSRMPGSAITPEQASAAATRYRDLARSFARP
ncbi:hypothetical protein DMB66_26430 [Actinoplanes sp. ATCC 53533]|uniref:hypothetical protein n=1 Tax=Actinoplanes sp. ATCC 53533 TaxID=1288362 RepID=UPI000F79C928|nr:hypothetical protein [Actinoplanes sp. ATCC 53533]RSM59791.1 hypothetical protein DMB66_26430 [Actinoplanes sp. ATCC 53533]